MMTLDEAIIHCEDVARQNEDDAIAYSNFKNHRKNLYEIELAENGEKKCRKCAEEHRQLAEWLYELRARRQMTEPEKVTCITCKYSGTTHIEGRRLPDDICTAQIWEKLNKAPHVIGHDLHEPIWCDHWEPKGGTEG